jgi:hypothetical protein
VLTLMDKGVTGGQNVRMLRDAATVGLSVAWNYLHGFPGEDAEDYDDVVDQLAALEHLNPPVGPSSRIAIERFSPYFDNPGLGFSELRPAEPYRLTYDLPDEEMFDLAYVFDVPPRGIGEDVVERLDAGIARWKRNYAGSRLTHCDLEDRIVLVSRRRAFDWTRLELTDPRELALFRLLDQPHTVKAAARKLDADHPVGEADLLRVLKRWRELGVVFEDSGQFVQIAPPALNEEFLRIDHMRHTAAREAELASTTA